MSPTAYLASLATLTLSLLAGCGGNVVIDKSGLNEGGNGAGGGGTGGAGATITTTTTVTNTSDYCSSVCSAANQYGCINGDLAGCVASCIDTFSTYPTCTSEVIDIYDCAVQYLSQYGCNSTESACQEQLTAFNNCAGDTPSTCGTSSCTSDTYSCSCDGECYGYLLQVVCKGEPGSTSECQCIQDGQTVGTCQDNNLACDFFGCCAAYFPI